MIKTSSVSVTPFDEELLNVIKYYIYITLTATSSPLTVFITASVSRWDIFGSKFDLKNVSSELMLETGKMDECKDLKQM